MGFQLKFDSPGWSKFVTGETLPNYPWEADVVQFLDQYLRY
jgi:hypothetical protein